MIEKIIDIRNVGRFHDYSAKGDVTFQKLTLVYAENGQGKTTLCAILRSLVSGRPELISERKTLGTDGSAFIKLKVNGKIATFADNLWSETIPQMAIYDSVFVNENVYAGDYVEHEHKKNLYRVIVGEKGVRLAQRVNDLDLSIRDASNDIRTKQAVVEQLAPSDVPLNDFLKMDPVPDIDAQIKIQTHSLATAQRAVEKSQEIRAKVYLSYVELPRLPDGLAETLGKQLSDVSADAESRVTHHISTTLDVRGQVWLEQGHGYEKGEICPFCGVSVEGNALIKAYKAFFNVGYRELKQTINDLEDSVNRAIGENAVFGLQQIITGNHTLTEFWRQFVRAELPELRIEDIRAVYMDLRAACVDLIMRKRAKPLELITPSSAYNDAIRALTEMQQHVTAYNAVVSNANEGIEKQKGSIEDPKLMPSLEQHLAQLMAAKHRFEPDVDRACQVYQASLGSKKALEDQKKSARADLDQFCVKILSRYQEKINEYLDQFNVGFRIAQTKHRYTGGSPSTHYQISIGGKPVDLGDSKTPVGTPCFRTTLSAGDRSTLALAFFLAALDQDSGIENKLVVLDDPFTSLDCFRRTCTKQILCSLTERTRQVVVLSHDPLFLKSIWDDCRAGSKKALQICWGGGTARISEWDAEEATQSEYLKNYDTLMRYSREMTGDAREVARSIRPFVEHAMRVHYPGEFGTNEWLGEFIGRVRTADESAALDHAKRDLSEIEAINDYSKDFHHDQNPNHKIHPIDNQELHGYVKRTLRLISGN